MVCTGGEPLLQLDDAAVAALHAGGFEVAVETNGTRRPRRRHRLDLREPQGRGRAGGARRATSSSWSIPRPGAEPERFEQLDFRHFFLQPMDGPEREANTAAALRYCLAHPRWRLSLQTHKLLGIP